MSIDIGIIGTGNMGRNHARVCSMIKDLNFIGVCDINEEKARNISQLFKVEYFTDYKRMLDKVDAVVIAVQTVYHYDIARFFLENGVHVLVEKPIASDIYQAKELVNTAEKNFLKLAVGHIERFNSAYRILKNATRNENIFAVEINRMSPWDDRVTDIDVVMDLMIHDIDLITDLIGCNISTVHNSGRKIKNASGFFDYYTSILEFENKVIGKLTASRVTEQKIREIKVTAEKKYFEADLLRKELNIYSRTRFENLEDSKCLYKQENNIEKVNIPYNEPLYDEICDFRNSILNDTKPLVSGEDGLRALTNIISIMSENIKE